MKKKTSDAIYVILKVYTNQILKSIQNYYTQETIRNINAIYVHLKPFIKFHQNHITRMYIHQDHPLTLGFKIPQSNSSIIVE